MSFQQYYDNRARYESLLREAEKERLIHQIQLANREKNRNKSHQEKSSWIQKISWAIKNANEISAS